MMKMKSRLGWAIRAVVAAGLIPVSLQVSALEYQVSDDLKVDVDTTMTYGRQWRVDGRDKNLMGGHIDQAAALNNPSTSEFKQLVQLVNSDDGTRNFDKWDTVSSRYSVVTDIDISYKNVGFFIRPQVFYDEVPFGETSWSGKYLDPRIGAIGDNNQLSAGKINSVDHWDDDYKDTLGYQARFLDVYAYGTFDIDGKSLELRAGRQVISWGEALMLQGGIAFAQNPNDASAATQPGVELKEIFLPTGAVYGSFAASENVTLEAYWQYEWIESTLFPTGSFFEMQDFIAGDEFLFLPQVPAGFMRSENEPDNNDQYGLGLRYLLGEGTEAAFYLVNYTDKYPMFWAANGYAEDLPLSSLAGDEFGINYFDDIRMYGLTLNTVVSNVQLGIEYAYRANAPLVPACTPEGLMGQHCEDHSYSAIFGFDSWPTDLGTAMTRANAAFSWPRRAEIHTLNTGITYIFQPNPLWDTATLVAELGSWYVGGFENEDLQFAHLGAFTKYGQGMSAQFMPEYKNVMEGVDLTIPFFVNYGIDGSFSTFNYNEHNLWWSVGAEAVYLEHWRFATYYNDYSGPNNLWVDRDNVSFNIKYTF